MKKTLLPLFFIFSLSQIVSCNSEEPVDGLTSLVNVTTEVIGQNCQAGGFRVDSGVDNDRDNLLDQNEIQSSVYVCNGSNGSNGADGGNGQNGNDGLSSLINVTAEQAVSNCSGSGYKVETGLDNNKDGVLSIDEVTKIFFVCDGNLVSYGKHAIAISGDVTDEEAEAIIAADLGILTQQVRVIGCSNLTTLDLSGLETAIEISIYDNPALKSVDLGTLKSVTGDLTIQNTNVESLDLTSLTNVYGGYFLIESAKLENVILPAFKQGALVAVGSSSVKSISAPLMKKVGTLTLSASNLNAVDFTALAEGSVSVRSGQLQQLNLPQFTRGSLNIEAGNLSDLSLPNFIRGGLHVENTKLTSIEFPSLTDAGELSFILNNHLTNIDFANLDSALAIVVNANPVLETINLPVLKGGTEGTDLNGDGMISSLILDINQNNLLAAFSAPALAETGTISFNSNASLISFSAPALKKIYNLSFENNPALSDFTIPQLTALTHAFGVNNSKLTASMVNSLLNNLVQITPAITGRQISFLQIPAAPPTGQGLTDKNILIANGNTVTTD